MKQIIRQGISSTSTFQLNQIEYDLKRNRKEKKKNFQNERIHVNGNNESRPKLIKGTFCSLAAWFKRI